MTPTSKRHHLSIKGNYVNLVLGSSEEDLDRRMEKKIADLEGRDSILVLDPDVNRDTYVSSSVSRIDARSLFESRAKSDYTSEPLITMMRTGRLIMVFKDLEKLVRLGFSKDDIRSMVFAAGTGHELFIGTSDSTSEETEFLINKLMKRKDITLEYSVRDTI